jgi:hypothetical protein
VSDRPNRRGFARDCQRLPRMDSGRCNGTREVTRRIPCTRHLGARLAGHVPRPTNASTSKPAAKAAAPHIHRMTSRFRSGRLSTCTLPRLSLAPHLPSGRGGA